tara:strand:- start:204 stop:914 length:711 start_codon:yes stop_codon:yes gene_type:complete
MNTDNKLQKIIKLLKDKIFFIWISFITNEEKKFNFIYKNKYWQNIDNGSLSGAGSNLDDSTHNLSLELPKFINKYKIGSLVDIPCGDWAWMSKLELSNINYTGCDIVEDMIEVNNKKYKNSKITFIKKNLSCDDLPKADMILVRDLLVHLKYPDIISCLNNIKKHKYAYIAITNFPSLGENIDNRFGDRWKPINFNLKPYLLPKPDLVLPDDSQIGEYDSQKTIAIWKYENFHGWS